MSLSSGELDREYPDGTPAALQPRWRKDFPTDVPEDDAVARREFTKFLVLTSGAFTAGQLWIGLMSLVRRPGPLPTKRIALEADVPPAGVVQFRYPTEDDPCLLLRLADGRLVAYGQKCTHLSCAVIPEPGNHQLHCPCHNGFLSATTAALWPARRGGRCRSSGWNCETAKSMPSAWRRVPHETASYPLAKNDHQRRR
jgi:nitrite reductase/ring-hydroxylating ferredoxin subunit